MLDRVSVTPSAAVHSSGMISRGRGRDDEHQTEVEQRAADPQHRDSYSSDDLVSNRTGRTRYRHATPVTKIPTIT